ncbi:MAG: hypothetical protein CVV42_00445 [Candidatus Riflebacteria bacterium HGW-Riflebacteria-2]|jgi:hypothetical protein|nr:MAG: hypothetical protein CVV42_00445 [Candidatus Riflebacteria bacterium HGW-Riflebacteria-2]
MKAALTAFNTLARRNLLRLTLLTMLILLPAGLWALIGFGPENATFRIIDAVQYQQTGLLSLDIEIITPGPDLAPHIMVPGRRFNLGLAEPKNLELKIGQKLRGSFSGAIKDLQNGQIMMHVDPASLKIIEEPADSCEIVYSDWEPYFDWLPHLKVAFIAFWWLIASLLVYRRNAQD